MQNMKPRVLWVDDDARSDKHKSTLRLFGPSFDLSILDSTERLDWELQNRSVDVVLLDIVFHDQRTAGIDALRGIRARYPEQRVLVLTGSSYGPDLDSVAKICDDSHGRVVMREKPTRALDIIKFVEAWVCGSSADRKE